MGVVNYEIIDHTADIGIRVAGLNLEEIFISAAEAMFDVMVTSKPNLIPAISVQVELNADTKEELLIKWLQELLYIFDTRHLVLSHFFIDEISDATLIGSAKGLKFDTTRHELTRQIKAVTHHMASLEKKENGWHAQVLFDI